MTRNRVVTIAFAATCLIVLAACGRSSPSALDPHSPQARSIDGLWWLMAGLGAVVYVAVVVVVLLALRNRRQVTDSDAQRRGSRFIVVGGVVVPAIVLSVVGVATITTTNALQPPAAAVHINLEAERWWWRLTYPDDGVVTANEIHVPVGQPVELTLTSDNVIHSVWVPQLDGKTDVIPGQTNHMTFTADKAGTYRGQCAEFCGIGHALMAFVVVAQAPADYQRWIAANRAPAAQPATDLARQGAQLLATTSCAGCHTVAGTAATGTVGPDLTHFGSRTSIAA
ncbi:MAG TPA: cytochrome c oxidase subunit II, partial [Ilumatobacteraceae bacterium]